LNLRPPGYEHTRPHPRHACASHPSEVSPDDAAVMTPEPPDVPSGLATSRSEIWSETQAHAGTLPPVVRLLLRRAPSAPTASRSTGGRAATALAMSLSGGQGVSSTPVKSSSSGVGASGSQPRPETLAGRVEPARCGIPNCNANAPCMRPCTPVSFLRSAGCSARDAGLDAGHMSTGRSAALFPASAR
jgi:hypothetical protein